MSNYFTTSEKIKLRKLTYATVDVGDNIDPYTTFTAAATGDGLNTTDDYYNDYILKFTSGALNGTEVVIIDYVGDTSTFITEDAGGEIVSAVTFELYHTVIVEDKKHSQPFSNLAIIIQPTSVTTYDYDVLYDNESQQSGTVTDLQDMITYSDASQLFPPNEPNSNWARQAAGEVINGYPITAKVVHKGDAAVLFKVSIMTESCSSVI